MLDLMFVYWHVDPVIFNIGNLSIRWYSLLFISGFILGWYIFKWFFKREGVSESLLDPLLYTLLIGTIVGARLGHCLFYQWTITSAAGRDSGRSSCHGKAVSPATEAP